ncbi:MAG: hypothetical protein WKG07_40380 [Hymenobacter sp.]
MTEPAALAEAIAGRPAGGARRVRRRHPAHRALGPTPAAHRDSGARRPATAPSSTLASASAACSVDTRRSSRRRHRSCSTPPRRDRMGAAAVEAARAVGYTGAGTVEFIVVGRPAGGVLLHGDEHPAAGRAPGDRTRDRPGSGRAAAPRGGR